MSTLYVDNLQPNLGSGVSIPGHVVQTVHVKKSDSQVSWTGTNVYLGLEAAITPQFATSKILAVCSLSPISTNGVGRVEFFLRWGTTSGDTSGASTDAAWVATNTSAGTTGMMSLTFSDLVTAGTTSPLYFKLCSTKHDSGTAYLNYFSSGANSITLMEIAQ